MIERRVGEIHDQYDEKLKDMEAKHNAMLRLKMIDISTKQQSKSKERQEETPNINVINVKEKKEHDTRSLERIINERVQ